MPIEAFPHPGLAPPNGLLAVGGDLSETSLITAYHFGIYPWYAEGEQIMWWSPDPRCVLYPPELKVSKSMRSLLRKATYTVTSDRAFRSVILQCKNVSRSGQQGTWITEDMVDAYCALNEKGHAHSIEVWDESRLVGGLYGIALGQMFFGESMFALEPNASKYGFIRMVQKLQSRNYTLVDCQQDTPHLRSLGATLISRIKFLDLLRQNRCREYIPASWAAWSF